MMDTNERALDQMLVTAQLLSEAVREAYTSGGMTTASLVMANRLASAWQRLGCAILECTCVTPDQAEGESSQGELPPDRNR
jgi:hypothetical protein